MNGIKTVFWDLDGTIAETEIYGHRIAFNNAFKEFGLDWIWNSNEYKNLLKISGGKNRIKHYSQIEKISLKEEDIIRIHKIKQHYYTQLVQSGKIPLRVGVERLISQLYSMNVYQYLVTTSGRKAAMALMEKSLANYREIFAGFITYEDVEKHKPYPDAYLKALSLSRSNNSNSIVIEDSAIGLKAALNAGLKCIITLSPWTEFSANCFNGAEAIVDSLGSNDDKTHLFLGKELIKQYVCADYLNSLIGY
tara:strand:+ start:1062 stop:1811 length:750 start_codon:yes stop_codon:yes gene_type:complete